MTSSTEAPGDTGVRQGLPAAQVDCLRCIAGRVVPASAEFGLPGADDPTILADMVGSLDRDRGVLAAVLARVDEEAGGRLADLDHGARETLLTAMRQADPASFAVVEAVVVRAYYRDDRVLAAIGMEARPPFPRGYDVPATDWSLLEPVRARGQRWRSAG